MYSFSSSGVLIFWFIFASRSSLKSSLRDFSLIAANTFAFLSKDLGKDKVTNPHPIFYQLSDEACKRRVIDKKEMDALNKMYWAESECIHGKKQIESDECLEYINLTKSVISKLL